MPQDDLFLLDTSALLALRADERGARDVEALLRMAAKNQCRVLVSFMTRMELLYLIRREEGEERAHEALRLIDSFVIEWISCEEEIMELASQLKSRRSLSVADSWIAASSMLHGATLVHKDAEFTVLVEIPQRVLT